jgi:hypothetical protein
MKTLPFVALTFTEDLLQSLVVIKNTDERLVTYSFSSLSYTNV